MPNPLDQVEEVVSPLLADHFAENLPELTYVLSERGIYLSAVCVACWHSLRLLFDPDYPASVFNHGFTVTAGDGLRQ